MSRVHFELQRLYPNLLLLVMALVMVVAAVQPAQAQYVESVPYAFTGGNDGAYPAAGLISDSVGNLYGTTAYGGPSSCPGFNPPTGCGVVFQLIPPSGGGSWTENVLYAFTGGSDGAYPQASLAFYKGNLYGTTANGGDTGGSNCSAIGGCGVVFELSPPSGGSGPWTETVLYTFTGGSDGSVPYSDVIFDSNGNLYGTTTGGGIPPGCESNCGFGVVYQLSPPAGGSGPWTETLLYVFTGASDGDTPQAGLIFDASGNLYGTTLNGGSRTCASGHLGPCGVVFELSPPSGGGVPWNEFVLYTFKGSSDGANPWAGVTFDSNEKNLYGTTSHGGNMSGSTCSPTYGCGVVFELSPPSGGGGPWTETVPYTFTGQSDGGYPEAGVIFDPTGNLYGTTSLGGNIAGTNCSPSGCGLVFKLTPPKSGSGPWSETPLYAFNGGSDGGFPFAGLLSDAVFDLFGTASGGGDTSGSNCTGAGGCGVVFELSAPGAPVVTLSPVSLTFGTQLVGSTSKAQTVTVTNTGTGTLYFNSITISANFAISTNTCGASLGMGSSCTVSVAFAPMQGGTLSGALTFTDNAPNSPQQVSLSGTGVPQAALTPASAKYAKQKVGTTSKPKKFTLTNNQSVTLTSIAISTTGDFAVSSTTCGASLGAKKKCAIYVTFTPTQKGSRTGQLSVSDSAIGSPQTASLTGTGD